MHRQKDQHTENARPDLIIYNLMLDFQRLLYEPTSLTLVFSLTQVLKKLTRTLQLKKLFTTEAMSLQLWIFILRVHLEYQSHQSNIWFTETRLLTYHSTQAYRQLSKIFNNDIVKLIIGFLPDHNHIFSLLTQLDILQKHLREEVEISETCFQLENHFEVFDNVIFNIVKNTLLQNLKEGKPWSHEFILCINKMKTLKVPPTVYPHLESALDYLLGNKRHYSPPQSLIDSHLSVRKPLATLHPKSNELQSARSNNQNSSSCAYAAAITHFTAYATQLANKKPVVKADKENLDTLRLIIMLLQNTKFGWQRGPFKIPSALFKGHLKAIAQPYKQLLLEAASGNQNLRPLSSSRSL